MAQHIVQFTKRYRMYNGGERAGFNADMAARLVKAGFATHVGAKKPAEPEEKPEESAAEETKSRRKSRRSSG